MNDDQLNELFKTARSAKPDTARVELGFETRLLARLRAERAQTGPWYAFAWKLMPVFAAIVVALGVWNFAAIRSDPADLNAAITADTDESPVGNYLMGE
jgi:hypothetical protein